MKTKFTSQDIGFEIKSMKLQSNYIIDFRNNINDRPSIFMNWKKDILDIPNIQESKQKIL